MGWVALVSTGVLVGQTGDHACNGRRMVRGRVTEAALSVLAV